MKKNSFIFLFAVASLGFLASCSEDDNETTGARVEKPVVTADATNFTVTEGETVTINLTTNTPYFRPMAFKLELVGGTGSFRDYDCSGTETVLDDGWGVIGHKLSFPAFASEASFDITPILDLLPEGTETFVFRLYPMGNSNGLVAAASETITVTVNNGTSDDVVTVVDWSENSYDAHGSLVDGTYLGADGDEHALCDYDFDLEIYDENFDYYATSYSSCPEQASVLGADADGMYFIVPSFWTTAGPSAPAEDLRFNVKVTIAKPGVWVSESVITSWNTVDGGAVEGNPDAYLLAGILTKTGTTYVLEDTDGNILASGRQASVLNRIPRKTSK